MTRLGDARVRRAAAPFVRVLIRVPEAYAILRPYATTRPGLLVLDADGRRVDSIDLQKLTDSAAIARRLAAARAAPARERFLVRARDRAAARALAARWKGKAEGRLVELEVAAGKLDPGSLDATVLEPVAVRGPDLGRPPGTWYAGADRIHVAALLLPPGVGGDTDARRFGLPGVGQGPPAARVPLAARAAPGVLAIFPDLFGEAITVVGRKGEISWPAVVEAMERAGAKVTSPK